MNKLLFDGPINSLSLGNTSFNFLREIWKKNVDTCFFPVGDNADFNSFDKVDPAFLEWVKQSGFKRLTSFNKDIPTLKNWHINGSERRISKDQYLYTYHETSRATPEEINIVKQQNHVFFSSSYSANIFKDAGCDNVSNIPLGFDEDFSIIENKFPKDVIHFGLIGKFERRKNTKLIIQSFIKKYGNNNKYLLTCVVNNPFFKPEDFKAVVMDATFGKVWSNINFLPFMPKNSQVNEFLNSIDIDLSGYSNGEGWNMGAFNSTALGKWSIVSNCSSHKDWATEKNSIFIEPDGEQPCYDNYFFREGGSFNQGNYAILTQEKFISALELSETKAKQINEKGLLLQKEFTYKNSIEKILSKIEIDLK